jgi:metallo-beta-lactamase family protein
MKLTFIGAAHEVTGSCYFLEAMDKNILIDCGLEQGRDVYINEDIPVSFDAIDSILLTHAHMDHAGRLPILYAKGYRGKIHSTGATSGLCEVMLLDSAHIQEFEAEWRNRKGRRKSEEPRLPMYTVEDAKETISSFVSHEYNEKFSLFEGIEIRFVDGGHLLGSASIEVWITEGDIQKKIVFSGDIGNVNQPLIKDPQYMKEADYVIMESTYGDRNHGVSPDYIGELTRIMQTTFDRGGNVIIPSFAVGRTQVLLYFIGKIKTDKLISGHDNFKVYVDSPLANEATEIFQEYMIGYYDNEAMELVQKGINPLIFKGLMKSITSEESKAINYNKEPKVIIAASGMCDAGRIRHHLKHNLWRKESTILFVGHQSSGTLGKTILDGAKEVRLFGETISVHAEICKLAGVSGHADKDGLLTWIKQYSPKPKRVFVVHGEATICELFTKTLKDEIGLNAMAPFSGDIFDMAANEMIKQGSGLKANEMNLDKNLTSAYNRLLAAGTRLMALIKGNRTKYNKDIGKLSDQIETLIEKLEK